MVENIQEKLQYIQHIYEMEIPEWMCVLGKVKCIIGPKFQKAAQTRLIIYTIFLALNDEYSVCCVDCASGSLIGGY